MKRTQTIPKQSSKAHHDFRSFLKEHFRAAVSRNPRFSLRSFALQLGIDHSTLSQILRNKRSLSVRSLEIMGRRLGLSDRLIETYKQGLQKKLKRAERSVADLPGLQFDLDTFQLLSIWYHQAILELTHTRGFQTDSRWIARRLGISVEDVNIAVQRLLRLNLLAMASRTKWIDKSGDAEFQTEDLTLPAAQRVMREMHELAIDTLEGSTATEFINSHMAIALDSRKLPLLKKAADEFLNEARCLNEETDIKDEVYQVTISIFPLTKPQPEGDKHG